MKKVCCFLSALCALSFSFIVSANDVPPPMAQCEVPAFSHLADTPAQTSQANPGMMTPGMIAQWSRPLVDPTMPQMADATVTRAMPGGMSGQGMPMGGMGGMMGGMGPVPSPGLMGGMGGMGPVPGPMGSIVRPGVMPPPGMGGMGMGTMPMGGPGHMGPGMYQPMHGLEAERERAYTMLAKKYFEMAVSFHELALDVLQPNRDPSDSERVEYEHYTTKVEETFANFARTFKKISPTAQVGMLPELIDRAPSPEALRLLEELLDDIAR